MIETRVLFKKAYTIILEMVEQYRQRDAVPEGWLPFQNLIRSVDDNGMQDLRAAVEASLKPLHEHWIEQFPNIAIEGNKVKFEITILGKRDKNVGCFSLSANLKTKKIRAKVNVSLSEELFAAAIGPEKFSTKSFSHSVARSFTHEEIHAAQSALLAKRVLEDEGKEIEAFLKESFNSHVHLYDINGMDDKAREEMVYLAKEVEIEAFADNAAVHTLFLLYNETDKPLEAALEALASRKKLKEIAKKSRALGGYFFFKKHFPTQFAAAWNEFELQYREKLYHYGEGYGKAYKGKKRNPKKQLEKLLQPAIGVGEMLDESACE